MRFKRLELEAPRGKIGDHDHVDRRHMAEAHQPTDCSGCTSPYRNQSAQAGHASECQFVGCGNSGSGDAGHPSARHYEANWNDCAISAHSRFVRSKRAIQPRPHRA